MSQILIRRATATDACDLDLVAKIFLGSPTYFRRVDGCEPTVEMAAHEMIDRAKKQGPGYEKVFCLIEVDGQVIGVIDLHRNHLKPGECYLGLLLLLESQQGHGIGRKSYEAVERFIVDDLQCHTILLGVSERNQVDGFWRKMGFAPDGYTYTWQGANAVSQVTQYVKSL